MSRRCLVVFVSAFVLAVAGAAQAQPAPAPAQPGAEPAPAGRAPTGFTGSATVAASVESGRTDLTGVQLGFMGRRPYARNGAVTMSSNYQHGTTRTPDSRERITIANHFDAQAGVEHVFDDRWVLMVRTEAVRDTIQQIDYRINQILGLGPQMKRGRLQLRVIPGVALLNHDKNVPSENGFNFNYGFYQDATVAVNAVWMFSQSLYATHDVVDDNDYFVSLSTQLTGAITKRLSLQLSYAHSHESLLPVGVNPRYQKTMVGLQFNF